jgi:hypothetical protein
LAKVFNNRDLMEFITLQQLLPMIPVVLRAMMGPTHLQCHQECRECSILTLLTCMANSTKWDTLLMLDFNMVMANNSNMVFREDSATTNKSWATKGEDMAEDMVEDQVLMTTRVLMEIILRT